MRVVVSPEGQYFVAQCVEYNIAAHGDSPDGAMEAFGKAVIRYVLAQESIGRDPFKAARTGLADVGAKWNEAMSTGRTTIRTYPIPAFRTGPLAGAGSTSSNAEVSAEMVVAS